MECATLFLKEIGKETAIFPQEDGTFSYLVLHKVEGDTTSTYSPFTLLSQLKAQPVSGMTPYLTPKGKGKCISFKKSV